MNSHRIIFYIDGFNLYFGLKSMGWRHFYWLDLQQMCARLTLPYQRLVKIRYFTARINKAAEDKRKRQLTYLEAIETLPLLNIHYGTYLASAQTCFKCGHTFMKHSEKKSDVNIAVNLITDAMTDLYDSAVLISGDSDLTPAVDAIKTHFPGKRVLLYFPPKRSSHSLRKACHVYCGVLNRTTISKSQLPDVVTSKSGYPLKRPDHWK
ncbi:MAG: NYN domain-containing protein [Deltaproteobacteria bacterium]|nr:NYN domain-containing protein [Deltaproteobacteria bacterium]